MALILEVSARILLSPIFSASFIRSLHALIPFESRLYKYDLANDEEMRKRIGESASKRAQQFSYNEIFRKLISITTEKAHYSALPKKM